MLNDTQQTFIGDYGLNWGIYFASNSKLHPDLLSEPDYVTLIVNFVNQTWVTDPTTGLKATNRTKTPVYFKKCGLDGFNYSAVEEI